MDDTSAKPALEITGTDQVIALLGIYAGQVGSYTTLLWQVPALSLTAQSFLLTIALSDGNGFWAKVTAATLSAVISAASYALMHDQRGHAINHGELAKRLSERLDLGQLIDTKLDPPDGVPRPTDAHHVWTWRHEGRGIGRRAGLMYAVWKGCMIMFLLVDAVILYLVLPWALKITVVAVLVAAALTALLVNLSRRRQPAAR